MCEIWKQIKGFEGLYDVSNIGRIYNRRKKTYSNGYESHGYFLISPSKNGKPIKKGVHIIVYEAFIGEVPKGYDVHHKDHNPKNNCVDNLELIEKSIHGAMHKEKKPVIQYTLDGEFVAEFSSIREAERSTGISSTQISFCCKKKPHYHTAGGFIWKYLK